MESSSNDSRKFSARPPSHSGKIKLQLFPIDDSVQKIMQQVSSSGSARASYKHCMQFFLKVFSLVFAWLIASFNLTGETQPLSGIDSGSSKEDILSCTASEHKVG
jgi:hypothetical protein